jgi:hypothetical protein
MSGNIILLLAAVAWAGAMLGAVTVALCRVSADEVRKRDFRR